MEGLLLGILMRRGIGSRLPWFCVYIGWCLVSDVTNLLVLARFPGFYRQSYLFETLVDCVLQFAVLLELAWVVLRSIHTALDRRNVWLAGAILFLAGMMLWPWAAAEVPQFMSASPRLLMDLTSTMSLLRILCMVAIAAASQMFRIGWKDRELQVAAGLGLYSICSFAVAVIHSHTLTYSPLPDRAIAVAYLGVICYWIVQFAREPARRSPL
jgi:hypothetical protein